MYSHHSKIYHVAVQELCRLQECIKKECPENKDMHQLLEQNTMAYGKELALILEYPMQEAIKKLQVLQKEYFYTVSTVLVMFGKEGGELLKECKSILERQQKRMASRKKVLILTISAGNGHKTAAYAIEETFKRTYGYDYEVVVHDVDVDLNTIYESSVKYTPQVYKWLFESTDSGDYVGLVHNVGYPLFAKKLDEIIEAEAPDVVVSSYCFPGLGQWIQKSLRQREVYVPFITVVTDSTSIHHMWIAEGVDYYLVPNEETKQSMEKRGVSAAQIKVFGFPVSPYFFDDIDVAMERNNEGLASKLPTFLVSIGTGGSMKEVKFLNEFVKRFEGRAQCMVVTGKNKGIYQAVKSQIASPSVKVYGWITDMYKKLHMADVVVTKAGGATVMECVAIKKPMVITKVLPGQEQGNAELVEEYGLGRVLKKRESLLDVMEEFVFHPEMIEEIHKHFDQVTIAQSTYKTVHFIRELLEG